MCVSVFLSRVRVSQRSGGADQIQPRPGPGQELEQLLQEGCSFTVLDQPVSLDRLQLKNVDQLNATGQAKTTITTSLDCLLKINKSTIIVNWSDTGVCVFFLMLTKCVKPDDSKL